MQAQKIIEPEFYVDFVDSTDDGGWYVQETRSGKPFGSRVSVKIFSSRAGVVAAYDSGKIKWTKW